MKISGDKTTSLMGLFGALLVVQQTWAPELLPPQVAATAGALFIGLGGTACNKKELVIPGTEHPPRQPSQQELELAALRAELDELRGIPRPGYPERRDEHERV